MDGFCLCQSAVSCVVIEGLLDGAAEHELIEVMQQQVIFERVGVIPVSAAIGQSGQCGQIVIPGVMSESADVVFPWSGAEVIGNGGFTGP